MYNNYYLDSLNRQKEKIEDMIRNYQAPQPVNNFISTGQIATENTIEWRILNENEDVDNLYVKNKTLFLGDKNMVLKGVDGKLEKWEIKKVYPIDEKDVKISQLEAEIQKLKEKITNEHTELNEPITNGNKSNGIDDVNVEPKSKTNSKSISKQD